MLGSFQMVDFRGVFSVHGLKKGGFEYVVFFYLGFIIRPMNRLCLTEKTGNGLAKGQIPSIEPHRPVCSGGGSAGVGLTIQVGRWVMVSPPGKAQGSLLACVEGLECCDG